MYETVLSARGLTLLAIINIIRKMPEENPRQWHEKLPETLWAYRTSKREATGMTPYALTYGHDPILPMEIIV
ncbi:hypothetical protein L3X38_017771 [Prunus dulcis]|uniref:Uncharacterized protein n=1 Tax=Prunus dulcis TaxID=3755 RepID=A0AAD4ZA40_PRUDU|nr:hypothetical protein L3X38_017771 [Prunus dulcis]